MKRPGSVFILVVTLPILFSFQNCSQGGFVAQSSITQQAGLGSITGTDDTSPPPPTSEPIPTPVIINKNVIIDTKVPENFNQFIPNQFTLFWPFPSRAHPGLPIDFQFIVYEAFKQPLTWELITGPEGMTITTDGLLKWTPSANQMGTHAVTIKISRSIGNAITKSFSINVNTTDFIFVAAAGSDSASGTLNAPMKTIFAALQKLQNGDGKTIYVRGGIYKEHYNWEINGVTAPMRGKKFTANDPAIVMSYPGELFTLDSEFQGHGLWAYQTSYFIFKNFDSKNASAGERGGILVEGSDNCVIQNVKVSDANWSASNNVAGVEVEGAPNTIIDRVTAINNRDKSSTHWNSSNYLIYTDGNINGDIYVLRSHSSDSNVGYKIKHAGPNSRVIIHDSTSINDIDGFGGSSDFSSVRYSRFINSRGTGITVGMTDFVSGSNGTADSFAMGSMLLEHNTIYNSSNDSISFLDNYSGTSLVQKNIIFSTNMTGKLFFAAWPYVSSTAGFNPKIYKNVYYSSDITANSALFAVKRGNSSLTQWQNLGLDSQSIVMNPSFVDTTNFNISASSPAVFTNEEFAGAQLPIKP